MRKTSLNLLKASTGTVSRYLQTSTVLMIVALLKFPPTRTVPFVVVAAAESDRVSVVAS